MAYCPNCGQPLDENTNVCTSCNAQAEQSASNENTQKSTSQASFFQKLTDTPDSTTDYDAKDVADNKIMALLSYLGILVLIPMFAAQNSKFARYHVKQGFNLFLAYIAYAIVNYLLGMIRVTRYVWGIPYRTTPGIIVFICWLIGIPLFVLSILGIINAVQGKAKELPIIGKFKILK
jgi:uncharacterized membrane protein